MDKGLKNSGLPLVYGYRTTRCLPVGKDCTMNRITQFLSALSPAPRTAPAITARDLLERAMHTRGQSAFEAAQLRANARALLSVLR